MLGFLNIGKIPQMWLLFCLSFHLSFLCGPLCYRCNLTFAARLSLAALLLLANQSDASPPLARRQRLRFRTALEQQH